MTALKDSIQGKDKLDVPIKFIWNYASNTLVNQHSDINRTHEILQNDKDCEMIVVVENFMTSSAKYADLLLQYLMTTEQEDIVPNDYAGNMGYLIFGQPATSAKFEHRSLYWMTSEIARLLGDDVLQRFTEAAVNRSGCTICTPKCARAIPTAILSPANFARITQAIR